MVRGGASSAAPKTVRGDVGGSEDHMVDRKVLDFQSRLQERLAANREFNERMDRIARNILILAGAIEKMRKAGSDSQEIARVLQHAVEELRAEK